MPSAIARVSCPVCRTEFQAYLEQVLDVRVDPAAKQRLLSGAVNVVVCPRCGNAGALNLPFIYHDPEREVALLYLPMEAGRSEVERQKFAGQLTRQLMNTLAPEDRKGYLLQPETFITMESLVRRALELEGVTEEQMQRSQQQRVLLTQLLEAEPETWPTLLAEHEALIDEAFFSLLQYFFQASGAAAEAYSETEEVSPQARRFRQLYEYLIETHPVGRQLMARTEIVQRFADNPSAETLLEALIAAKDEQTVKVLVQMGVPLLDYAFFQQLLRRIEMAETPEEQARLKALRRQILDERELLSQAGQDLAQKRSELLEQLLNSADPLKMARSHLSELDDTFMYLLQLQFREAEQQENLPLLQKLQQLVDILSQISEESLPPEMRFVRRALAISDAAQLQEFLQSSRAFLRPEMLEFLEALEQEVRENGEPQVAEKLAQLRAKVQELIEPTEAAARPNLPSVAPGTGEQQTPSGLIISRR